MKRLIDNQVNENELEELYGGSGSGSGCQCDSACKKGISDEDDDSILF